jgi:hypothetical protein
MKPNTSVRELLEKRIGSSEPDYTDDTFNRIQEYFPEPVKHVPLKLSKEEKIAIFQDLKDRVKSGSSPDEIARDVILCVEDILKEKEDEITGKVGPKMHGFRGVE